ncbi:uncharacterized protein LOC124152745 [Haliotis rufescens]|uniref:uncharacterized protein LOC124152745 n=1 Tax=Haliotis rufescens TaxID=6454 RepID=UPI001EAFA984|nr:uncharacterized protein LOC124152745 [Haliotis rufescens]XP_046381742.1 uncharacterized protein LOC124152745 [Haliotis rufescens]
MKSWTSQFRNSEIARAQNKREERLLSLEIDSRRGIKDEHKYRMKNYEQEQRMVERELDRIRQGMKKKPLLPTASGNVGNLTLNGYSHVTPRVRNSRLENLMSNVKYANENLSPYERDSCHVRGIVPAENERHPQYESSDTIPDHSGNPSVSVLTIEAYPGLALLSPRESDRQDITERVVRSPRNIDPNVKEGHSSTDTPCEADTESLNDLDPRGKSIERNICGWEGASQNGLIESDIRSKRRSQRASLDLTQLASLDMKSVKTNVSRRLSEDPQRKDVTSNKTSRDVKRDDPEIVQIHEEDQAAKDKARRASRPRGPAVDAHKKPMDFDPEHYNPDGSLRRIHAMPSSDKTWEEAKKARYIRSKEATERERELSVDEIFGKKS